jgi:hypothetical protein
MEAVKGEVEVGVLLEAIKVLAEGVDRMGRAVEALVQQAGEQSPPLNVKDVMRLARVECDKTVYRWVEKGLLQPMAEGVRPLLFERAVVNEFLKKRGRGR